MWKVLGENKVPSSTPSLKIYFVLCTLQIYTTYDARWDTRYEKSRCNLFSSFITKAGLWLWQFVWYIWEDGIPTVFSSPMQYAWQMLRWEKKHSHVELQSSPDNRAVVFSIKNWSNKQAEALSGHYVLYTKHYKNGLPKTWTITRIERSSVERLSGLHCTIVSYLFQREALSSTQMPKPHPPLHAVPSCPALTSSYEQRSARPASALSTSNKVRNMNTSLVSFGFHSSTLSSIMIRFIVRLWKVNLLLWRLTLLSKPNRIAKMS